MGKIMGSSLTRDDSWMIEIAKIPQELRDEESELTLTRWFDYRTMMPAQLTYLFANRYEQIYRETYSKAQDYRKAAEVSPIRSADIFQSNDLLPIWRARQAADRIGCKYEFYLRFAFNRFIERGWRYFPRPNQLYGEELILDVVDAWAEATRSTLQLAERSRFKDGGYLGHPDQDAYHSYLVEQVKQREHQHMLLARLVFKEKVLPLSIASRFFDEGVLNRAKFF